MSATQNLEEDHVCRQKIVSTDQKSLRGSCPQMENSVCGSKVTERIMSADGKKCPQLKSHREDCVLGWKIVPADQIHREDHVCRQKIVAAAQKSTKRIVSADRK